MHNPTLLAVLCLPTVTLVIPYPTLPYQPSTTFEVRSELFEHRAIASAQQKRSPGKADNKLRTGQ